MIQPSNTKLPMGYPPNTHHWPVGSLVLHAGDAKRREMLMRVLGYTRAGVARTRYVTPNKMNGDIDHGRREWLNDPSRLLDPAKWNVSTDDL